MKNSPETLKKRNELKRRWKEQTDPDSFPHQILKKCKDCGEVKLCAWLSSFTQTGRPEYKARCIECHNAYLRKRNNLAKTKKLRNKRVRRYSIRSKQRAVDFFGGKCQRCGYSKSICALTFHHRNPEEKESDIGALNRRTWSKIVNELNKCDLLCFNCHMEVHEELNKQKREEQDEQTR